MTPYTGTKAEYNHKIYMIMKTPEGINGCSRCAFLHDCHKCSDLFGVLGNCDQGKDRYFVWLADSKTYMQRPDFIPLQIDEPEL